jgi:ABC-2 type transport system ATP-binding protein
MIEVRDISKRYGTIDALKNVSFTVKKGHIVGFLGANGAGKTTTMDILCGCIGPDQGSVSISGFDITEQPKEAKQRLGYLPDEPPLHNDMKVEQYVSYAAKLRGVAKADLNARVNETINKLSLESVRHRLIGNLSKGYRQRVGLAQCLVHNPEVLVLDEPTEGLDPSQIIQIRDLIKSLKGDHTIILSSHILSEVESICDEIVIIDRGQVVEQGTYNELVARGESGGKFHLRVRQAGAELVGKLEKIQGLANIKLINPGKHLIEFDAPSQGNVLDQVATMVVSGGHGLSELSSKSKSLEDIFLQLTQTHSPAQEART